MKTIKICAFICLITCLSNGIIAMEEDRALASTPEEAIVHLSDLRGSLVELGEQLRPVDTAADQAQHLLQTAIDTGVSDSTALTAYRDVISQYQNTIQKMVNDAIAELENLQNKLQPTMKTFAKGQYLFGQAETAKYLLRSEKQKALENYRYTAQLMREEIALAPTREQLNDAIQCLEAIGGALPALTKRIREVQALLEKANEDAAQEQVVKALSAYERVQNEIQHNWEEPQATPDKAGPANEPAHVAAPAVPVQHKNLPLPAAPAPSSNGTQTPIKQPEIKPAAPIEKTIAEPIAAEKEVHELIAEGRGKLKALLANNPGWSADLKNAAVGIIGELGAILLKRDEAVEKTVLDKYERFMVIIGKQPVQAAKTMTSIMAPAAPVQEKKPAPALPIDKEAQRQAFIKAITQDDQQVIAQFLENRAFDPNTPDRTGVTPILVAIQRLNTRDTDNSRATLMQLAHNKRIDLNQINAKTETRLIDEYIAKIRRSETRAFATSLFQ